MEEYNTEIAKCMYIRYILRIQGTDNRTVVPKRHPTSRLECLKNIWVRFSTWISSAFSTCKNSGETNMTPTFRELHIDNKSLRRGRTAAQFSTIIFSENLVRRKYSLERALEAVGWHQEAVGGLPEMAE